MKPGSPSVASPNRNVASPNRNVVAPSRNVVARRAARPRIEARTTEFDCSGIAALYDAHAAAPIDADPDLEAEIEIATDPDDAAIEPGRGGVAHTLRRGGEIAAGSQPYALPLAAPEQTPVNTADVLAYIEAEPDEPAPAVTTPMPSDMLEMLAGAAAFQAPTPLARARVWWVVGVLAFVASALALILAVRA